MTPDTLTILRIDPSVRVAELAKALDGIGLVLVAGERGLQVTTRSALELMRMRKQR